MPRECRAGLRAFFGSDTACAYMNFRLDMDPVVTCSDASSTGGGICCSVGLTAVGSMVEKGGGARTGTSSTG